MEENKAQQIPRSSTEGVTTQSADLNSLIPSAPNFGGAQQLQQQQQQVQQHQKRISIEIHLTREENDILNRMITCIEALKQKDDIEQIKTKVLYEIIESFVLLKNLRPKEQNRKTIKKVMKKLFMSKEVYAKESCIRALKKILKISKKIAPVMKEKKIHVLISFLIEREFKSNNVAKERMACLKFINAWMQYSPSSFPLIFGQILVSMARNVEDLQLRKKGVESLLSLATSCPEVAANVGALKLLVECLTDLSLQGIRYDLISSTLLLLVNDPKTRIYFRHFQDINRIFSVFTTVDGVDKDPKKEILDKILASMNLASKAIVNFMRNWNGVIYLTSSPLGLQSLVDSLTQPIRLYKKLAILDIFIDIFNIPIFIAGADTNSIGSNSICLSSSIVNFNENLLNNYVALLLQAFNFSGIYEALIKLGTSTEEGSDLNKKSKFLLKKIMYLSSYLLPDVPHFPQLIKIASDFNHENQYTRTRATKMIKELSTISLKNPLELSKHNEIFGGNQNHTTKDFSMLFMRVYEYFNSMQLGLPFNTVISNYLVDLKQYYFSEIDDPKFNLKIKQSGVLQQKDYRKWNWYIINEILEGNLLTPARLEEVMKKTKFIKRILNFFMPTKQQFINMEWREENLLYARSGYNLIKTLLSSKEGQKALSSSPGVFFMFGLTFVENKDNIFHHRKSFLQEICDILEREVNYLVQMRANYGRRNRRQNNQGGGQGAPNNGSQSARGANFGSNSSGSQNSMGSAFGNLSGQQTQATSSLQQQLQQNLGPTNQSSSSAQGQAQIGATDEQRFFTKTRLTQTMMREYISWLGLFTTTKDGIQLLKKFKIFEHLMQLVDNNGYYDHFCQIILQSFDYGFATSTRKMLEAWITKCSPNLAKSIIELFRMLFRSGLNDFYYWCLPFLNQLVAFGNYEEIAAAAFDVLEEVCFDQNSLNQLLIINEKILDSLKGEQSELFIAKLLRSQKGFQILKNDGWLSLKLQEWKEKQNQDYILRLERSLYEGLNMNPLNTSSTQHAINIWIPIYEHSNDLRNELMILKRYPFQIQIKVENLQNEIIVQESLQTYIECDSDNQLQIVGKVINKHSQLYGMPIENYYYIQVCMRLGSCYIDSHANECKDPYWTIIDVNDKSKQSTVANLNSSQSSIGMRDKNSKFRVVKNGIVFNFLRGSPQNNQGLTQQNQLSNNSERALDELQNKVFLDSVTFRVQVLPQKFKIIKTPIHLYGELVKTEEGANYLRQSRDVLQFKQEILSPDTPLIRKRAALWAIGHIGSSEFGYQIIQEADIMRELVKMAESAEILSIRGTCIYIMGLLCKSPQGQMDIKYCNWVSSQSSGISVCLPKEPSVLFKVQDYTFKGDLSHREDVWSKVQRLHQIIPLSEKEQEIIKLISNLINGVTEIQALNDLKKLLEKEKVLFVNPKIFEHVISLLSLYKFKPKARKFIYNMFEDIIFNDLMLPDSVIDI